MTNILNTFGSEAISLILWVVFAMLGYGVKRLTTRFLDTKEKQQLAKDVVTFVEQKYKDLHGPEKLSKAVEAFTLVLSEKGIKSTTSEIELLIESAVGAFNDAFHRE